MTQFSSTFLVGVNYWPRTKAMFWWREFDPEEVRADMAKIASWNLDGVRIFLLWEDFMPEPHSVSQRMLERLRQVLDLAHTQGLRVIITLFTGHMSGVNWLPPWLLNGERESDPRFRLIAGGHAVKGCLRDLYEDPLALEAQVRMLEGAAQAVRDHPALLAWDLGNEPDLVLRPRTLEAAAYWLSTLSQALREIDPAHPITIGFHSPVLEEDLGFRIRALAPMLDFLCMHAYSTYASWARHPLDEQILPFLTRLTASLSGKPVLFEEFGLPTAPPGQPTQRIHIQLEDRLSETLLISEEEAAAFYERALEALHRAGAVGAFLWCFGDYHPDLWDRPPFDRLVHERHFGLLRPDGSPKPAVEVVARFAAQKRPILPSPSPLPVPEDYEAHPGETLRALYALFLSAG
ncbi:MAG: cellulase family glycosylhydrolase [Anaerolineae bacterium]|nr:cellulase family glycosylhydrolase [Thermoflexus sp.]MDW8064714.1 cellulase family glycosylhydrolase [Anaerolineae bacterium]